MCTEWGKKQVFLRGQMYTALCVACPIAPHRPICTVYFRVIYPGNTEMLCDLLVIEQFPFDTFKL